MFLAGFWVRLSLPAHMAAACAAEVADSKGGGWVRVFTARSARGTPPLGEDTAVMQAANETTSRGWPVPLAGAGAGVRGPCVGFQATWPG